MSKRKSSGRITVEEVNALFQKPLRMLHPRTRDVESTPTPHASAASGVEHWAAQRAAPPTNTMTDKPNADASYQYPVVSKIDSVRKPRFTWLEWIQTAARHLRLRSPRESYQLLHPSGTSPTALLAARLGENLIEASRLAAQLQRRHREEQAEYERAVNDLRNLTTLLVDQIEAATRQSDRETGSR